jgi:hypothetical protein
MSLAGTVAKLSQPTPVTRLTLLVFGDDGRPDGSQTESTETVRLHLQRPGSQPTRLLREAEGDSTTGQTRVWVTDKALAAVGWTTLQIAPPEDAEGPPGDRIDWKGIRYEIIEWLGWDESFSGGAKFQRYLAAERGPTP